jgi:hypothetical protein
MEKNENDHKTEFKKIQLCKTSPKNISTSSIGDRVKVRLGRAETLAFNFKNLYSEKTRIKKEEEFTSSESDFDSKNFEESRKNKNYRRGLKKHIRQQSIPPLFSEPIFKQSLTGSKIDILQNDPIFSELINDLKKRKISYKMQQISKSCSINIRK